MAPATFFRPDTLPRLRACARLSEGEVLIAVTGFIGTVALTKYLQRGDIIELK